MVRIYGKTSNGEESKMTILDENVFTEDHKNESQVDNSSETLDYENKQTSIDRYVDREIGPGGTIKQRIKRLRKQLKPHKDSAVMWNEVGICPICGVQPSHRSAPFAKWRINFWFRHLTMSVLPEKLCLNCWAKDLTLQDLVREQIEAKIGKVRKSEKFAMTRYELNFWSQFYKIEMKDGKAEEGELCDVCREHGECLIERGIKKLGEKCKRI